MPARVEMSPASIERLIAAAVSPKARLVTSLALVEPLTIEELIEPTMLSSRRRASSMSTGSDLRRLANACVTFSVLVLTSFSLIVMPSFLLTFSLPDRPMRSAPAAWLTCLNCSSVIFFPSRSAVSHLSRNVLTPVVVERSN